MAKLDRLKICGIRSFGPNEEDIQNISFSSPVTLILGENGCGKTTIIESLRYACTGDYPDGSEKGSGFLQEPKLRVTSTTKGFVKLRIIDSKGKPIIINRSAKIERQAGGRLKLSKVDASINTTRPNGTEVALSSRCADIGEQICHIMGVSKAIINNVLFCHQENSLWPLEKDSVVKEKFDEIFDAGKYNKCISDLRKYITIETKGLETLKNSLRNKEEKKDSAEKKRANLQKNEDEVVEIVRNIAKKEEELQPISNEIQKICELETNYSKIQADLLAKEAERRSIKHNRQQLLEKIKKEFDGSDYELEEAIKNFERKSNKNAVELENAQIAVEKVEKELETMNASIQKAQVRLGQLDAEKKQQQERIEDRNNQINSVAKKLKLIPKLDSQDAVKHTLSLMNEAVNGIEKKINEEQEANQGEEKNQQEKIDACRETIAKLEQEKSLNTSQKGDVQKQHRDINSQLKQLDVSDELLKTMNSQIDQIDLQIQCLVDSYNPDELQAKIDSTTNEIEVLEKKLDELDRNYTTLQKNYVTEETIATRTRDVVKKESQIFKLKNSYYQDFQLLFDEVPEFDIRHAVDKRIREATNELEEIKTKIDIEKKRIATNETSIKINEDKLNSLVKKVIEVNEKVVETVQGNSFEQFCVDLEKTIENLQKERGQYRSALIIYEKFVKDFQTEKPCCPICETDFSNKHSIANEIAVKLRNKIEGLPQTLQQIEHELKKKQEIFSQAEQLKPRYTETKELEESTIPKLNSEIKQSKVALQLAQENLKLLNNTEIQPKKIIEVASKIVGDVTLIDKYNSEVESFKKEISNLRSKLLPSNTNRSKEQVERDIKVCKADILEKRKSCEADTKKLTNNKREYQELREQKAQTEKEKFHLEKSMHTKPQLLEQLVSLEEKEQSLIFGIKRLDQELIPLKGDLKNFQQTLNMLKADNNKKYKNSATEYNEIKAELHNLVKNQAVVVKINNQNIDDQLRTTLEKYNSYKTDEEKLNCKKKTLSEKIVNIKEDQAKAESNKRNLDDNLEIRRKTREIKALDESIQKLEDKVGAEDYTTLQTKKQQLERQCVDLIKDVSNIKGHKEALEKNITSLRDELELPENRNAYNIYRRACYEYKVQKWALSDARIYSKGLEEAVIQFHKEKMSKINEMIRDLWRAVYKGNDIDCIQIRTEQPETKSDSTKRSYNYRVVQLKHEVEIDMRGRCSAGQKVLACLLIRMALAMTFSHNCGILALDEPTTNLDKENIDSLCETLATMIQNRRVEKNFQLLIITHDEDFIRKLSQLESIDSCLRVKRNPHGNTIIETEAL